MKTIYSLREDRDYVAKVQAASLSPKPFGLKATDGLFGSEQWWHNIESGVIPLIRVTGTITRLLRTGMHNESESFEMLTPDGKSFQYDCVAAARRERLALRSDKTSSTRHPSASGNSSSDSAASAHLVKSSRDISLVR